MGEEKKGYSMNTVLEAIEGSGGVMLGISKRLGCNWDTARRYVNKWETTRKAFDAEKQKILDLAESTVYKAIKDGDVQSAKWVLATLGRDRGFSERQELVHSGEMNQKLTIEIVRPNETKNPGSV